MNKISPPKLVFEEIPQNDFDSRRIEMVYNRLFKEAWKRILDKQNTEKYTKGQI